jgi:exonuclease III
MSQRRQPLKLLTLNVNGLRGPGKVASLFWYLQLVAGNPDVVLLQELHLASKEELLAAMQQGRGHGLPYYATPYFSAGTATSCGVAVLVRQGGLLDDDLADSAVHVDTEGRWVRIDCMFLRQPLSICCAYAPNSARTVFFTALHDRVPAAGRVIMGGDFNCVCDPLLDQHPPSQTHTTRGEGASALKWLLAQRQLFDAYRHAEPQGTATTHTATHARGLPAAQQSKARLDRWYLSEEIRGWISSVRHLPCSWAGGGGQPGGTVGDHAGVLLVLEPPGLPTIGPGHDSFPVHLLYDREYLRELKKFAGAYFERHAAPAANVPGARWWVVVAA